MSRSSLEPPELDFFCVYCARERKIEILDSDPPDFVRLTDGCDNCGRGLYAYSPPATPRYDL